MTPEEIQEKIDAAVEAAVSKSNLEIEKLNKKNIALLNEKRSAKAQADEAEERAADAAAEAAARATNDTATIEKAVAAKYQKLVDAATAKATAADATLKKVLVDQGITAALQSANVAPSFAKAAAALLRSEGEISIADGVATINGEPLGDYVKTWAQTDGKDFIAAPLNAGGGSLGGSTGNQNANAWTRENFNSRVGEFMALVKTDKAAAIEAARSAGREDMISKI